MNLTNEDRELLDRHFEQDLTELEETQFQQKLADDDNFRQAVHLRELIHERVQAYGAAQLKEQLKANLAAQRDTTEWEEDDEESSRKEAPVRPLFGTTPTVRWAIAASFAILVAAAIVFVTQRGTPDGAPLAVEDSTKIEAPVSGGQQQAPTYAGTDTYTASYPIATEQTEAVAHALLIVDETRTEAAYQVRSDTLFVYYPQDIYAEILAVSDEENETILQINEDRYRIAPAADGSEKPLVILE